MSTAPIWEQFEDLRRQKPRERMRSPSKGLQAAWPDPMAKDAYHGLVGEIVQAIEPNTEADPAALVIQCLCAIGNAIGRGPHYAVEGDEHHANLFAVVVGPSGKARKGTSWSRVRQIVEHADPDWARNRVHSGLSSGEGVIWAVRDPTFEHDRKKPEEPPTISDPGVADKRLLALESEFSNVLTMIERQGNTLSRVVRDGWDRGSLASLTKNSPAKATGAHISIIGHITDDELRRHLSQTEAANGFANRFLFVCAKRSKSLPHGGDSLDPESIGLLGQKVALVLLKARRLGRVAMDPMTRQRWELAYPALSEGHPGLFGAVIARAEAQVVRLALLYALLDGSGSICAPHLRAALAVWEYCEASARYIFGATMGDPVADDILAALDEAGAHGLARTGIHNALGRNRSAAQIDRALDLLRSAGRVSNEKIETGGRPSELWRLSNNGGA